jgi:hypothetical protein
MPIKNILIDEHSKEVRVLVFAYRARDKYNTSTPTKLEWRKG